jgi:hypothetical protein
MMRLTSDTGPKSAEHGLQVTFRGVERQVPHVQFRIHDVLVRRAGCFQTVPDGRVSNHPLNQVQLKIHQGLERDIGSIALQADTFSG